jgi:hypothetical protein
MQRGGRVALSQQYKRLGDAKREEGNVVLAVQGRKVKSRVVLAVQTA